MPVDPLTALGAAASVMNVIEFSVEACKETYKRRKELENGEKYQNTAIGEMTTRIRTLVEELKGQKGTHDGQVARSIRLRETCDECSTISSEISEVIQTLKIAEDSKHKHWDTMMKGLKTAWKKTALDAKVERLESLKHDMILQLVLILCTEQTTSAVNQGSQLEKLHTGIESILATISKYRAERVAESEGFSRTFQRAVDVKVDKGTETVVKAITESGNAQSIQLLNEILEALRLDAQKREGENSEDQIQD